LLLPSAISAQLGKTDIDLQAFAVPHPLTGHKYAKLNSVEVNMLLGGKP